MSGFKIAAKRLTKRDDRSIKEFLTGLRLLFDPDNGLSVSNRFVNMSGRNQGLLVWNPTEKNYLGSIVWNPGEWLVVFHNDNTKVLLICDDETYQSLFN